MAPPGTEHTPTRGSPKPPERPGWFDAGRAGGPGRRDQPPRVARPSDKPTGNPLRQGSPGVDTLANVPVERLSDGRTRVTPPLMGDEVIGLAAGDPVLVRGLGGGP